MLMISQWSRTFNSVILCFSWVVNYYFDARKYFLNRTILGGKFRSVFLKTFNSIDF